MRLFWIVNISIRLMLSLLSIPILYLSAIAFKYSDDQYIEEYQGNFNFSEGNIKVLVLVGILLFSVVLVSENCILFETRHYASKMFLYSRATGQVELFRWIGIYGLIAGCVLVGDQNPYVVYIGVIIANVSGAYKYFAVRPFYNDSMNVLYACMNVVIAWTAFSFIVALFIEEGQLVFLMQIIITPLLIAFTRTIFNYYKITASNLEANAINKENYEQYLRIGFVTSSVDFNWKQYIPKIDIDIENLIMFYVWRTYFYYGTKGKTSKARLILSNLPLGMDLTFVNTYQLFRCLTLIQATSSEQSFLFLSVVSKIRATKENDLYLTKHVREIWLQLLRKRPSAESIKHRIQLTTKLISKQKHDYMLLLRTDPNNTDILLLYGSFLLAHCNKEAEGDHLISKAANIGNNIDKHLKVNLFSAGSAIVLLQCYRGYDIKIKYTNNKADLLLGYSQGELLGKSFEILIPFCYRKAHERIIYNFYKRKTTSIAFPSNFFLLNSSGFLVMISIQARMDSLDQIPHIILVFRKNNDIPSVSAVVTPEGSFIGYTREFCNAMKLNNNPHEEANILSFFDIQHELSKKCDSSKTVSLTEIIVLRYAPVRSINLFIVSVLSNDKSTIRITTTFKKGTTLQSDFHLEMEEYIDRTIRAPPSSNRTDLTFRQDGNPSISKSHSSDIYEAYFTKLNTQVANIYKRIGYSMVGYILINIILLIGNSIMYAVTVDDTNKIFENISYLDQRTYSFIKAKNIARFIDLETNGLAIEEEGILLDKLNKIIKDLKESDTKIRDFYEQASSSTFRDMYENSIIPIWYMEGGGVLMKYENLFQVTAEYIVHLTHVKENYGNSLTLGDHSLFFLYRNGFDSSEQYSIESTNRYFEDHDFYIYLLDIFLIINKIVFTGAYLIGLLGISFKLRLLQTIINRIWDSLYNLQLEIVQNKYEIMERRLDLLECRESIPGRYKDIQNRPRIKYERPWRGILASIVVYIAISIAGIYISEVYIIGDAKDLRSKTKDLSILISEQSVVSIQLFELATEELLLRTPHSIYIAIPNNNPLPSPYRRIDKYLKILKMNNQRILTYFNSGLFSETSEIFTEYLDRKANYEHPSGAFGLYAQLVYYDSYIRGIKNSDSDVDIHDFHLLAEEIAHSFMSLEQKIREDLISKSLTRKSIDLGIVSLLIVISFFYGIFCIFAILLPKKRSIEISLKFLKIHQLKS